MAIAFATAFLASSPLEAAPKFRQYRGDRLIVQLKEGVSEDKLETFHKLKGHRHRRNGKNLRGMHLLELAKGMQPEAEAKRYMESGLVEFAEPDYILKPSVIPNDPSFTSGGLWGLNNLGQSGGKADADIDAPEAWNTVHSGSNIVVAVIDSGIRYTHEDLAANMWRNPGEVENGLDDDGNGFVDDIHGIDAMTMSGDPLDDSGHGTHVAGTIGAVGSNGKGVVGVAWNVKLMALRFLGADETGGATSDAITCINYAVANGAKVINASWGGPGYSFALEKAIRNAANAGVIFVTAAGNDAENNDLYPSYPANYSLKNIVTVAAMDSHDTLDTTYSNYGATKVHLAAPGTGILSTWFTRDDAYIAISGTSMAAPHVTGAVALLRSFYPTDTYIGTIQRLLAGTDKLPNLTGKVSSGGRLNLASLFPRAWEVAAQKQGSGTVKVEPEQAAYPQGTTVKLTATASAGYQFAGWTGVVAATSNPLSIEVNTNIAVTAIFKPLWKLAAITTAGGELSITPEGTEFLEGTSVQLAAIPSPGFEFSHWEGDSTETSPTISLGMNTNKTVQAIFVPAYTFAVGGNTGGVVHYSPIKPHYLAGELISISATPAAGYAFAGWSNGESSSTLSFEINGNTNLEATFTKTTEQSYSIAVSTSGEGVVEINPHKASYKPGESVQISAMAEKGYKFVGWKGLPSLIENGSSENNIVTIIMNENKNVEAVFEGTEIKLSLVQAGGDALTFLVRGAAEFLIETSSDLQAWSPLSEIRKETNAEGTTVQVQKPAGNTHHFFRVVLP